MNTNTLVQNHSDDKDKRRQFLLKAASVFGMTLSASALATLAESCETNKVLAPAVTATASFSVSNNATLAIVGNGISTRLTSGDVVRDVIIIRALQDTSLDNAFLVFSGLCTHAGCTLTPPAQGLPLITCYFQDNNCGHGAEYSPTTGEQTEPPAGGAKTGNLTQYTTTFNTQTNLLSIKLT